MLCNEFLKKPFIRQNKQLKKGNKTEQWTETTCHDDFAVLGQFELKSLLWGFNHKQNASVSLSQRYQMNFIREG